MSTVPSAPALPLVPPPVFSAALRDDPTTLASLDDVRISPTAIVRALSCALVGTSLFGLALGSFNGSALQMVSSALKAPMLLLGTTALCFPAFFVMQLTQVQRPLSLRSALSVQAHALAATAVWWGALALPLLFLASTAHHYRLAQGLALVVGAVGGLAGLRRFRQRFRLRSSLGDHNLLRGSMAAYFALYGVVGAQLSWFLRPFVGDPERGFELVRGLESNFFAFVLGPLWS
ncbi:MAG: hypothetical protein K0V04_09555 [Deltaproteobacteria bacterium]|nr:hypothetical protein [Deltaproteobacteria bacterium]